MRLLRFQNRQCQDWLNQIQNHNQVFENFLQNQLEAFGIRLRAQLEVFVTLLRFQLEVFATRLRTQLFQCFVLKREKMFFLNKKYSIIFEK